MRGLLNQFMQFGERLEAVVSIIGVAVLVVDFELVLSQGVLDGVDGWAFTRANAKAL